MIEKLSNNILINDKIKTVYNFNEYSIQDLLSKFFEKINDTVEVSNNALDFLNYLKNEGLPLEVVKEINLMYEDGRLTSLIDNLSGNLTNKIDNINVSINNIKEEYIPNYNINGGDF